MALEKNELVRNNCRYEMPNSKQTIEVRKTRRERGIIGERETQVSISWCSSGCEYTSLKQACMNERARVYAHSRQLRETDLLCVDIEGSVDSLQETVFYRDNGQQVSSKFNEREGKKEIRTRHQGSRLGYRDQLRQ